MKKILLFLSLVFCLFGPTVSAHTNSFVTKSLVCTVGYDYSFLLEYDGYEIISKAVDFNSVGTYYVSYLNKTTKETVIKRVDVINESSLLGNGYYRSNNTQLTSNNYQMIDSCTHNGITYLLQTERVNDIYNLVLSKVENNSITTTRVIKEGVEATFNKILVDEDGLYVLGTIYKEGYSIDLYLLNVSFDLKLVFENTIGGTGVDNLTDSTIYGDYIYLVGNTTSSGGYFTGTRKKEDGFVMKVTKELFNVEKVSMSALSNINTYTNITIKDDYIYLFEQSSNTESVSYTTKLYTLDLQVHKSQPFINSHALTPNKLVTKDEGVFLICFQYNYLLEKYASRIYLINDDATTSLYYDYPNYEEENIRIEDLTFNESQMIILTYDYNFLTTKLIIKDLKTKESSTLSINSKEPLNFISANAFITLDYNVVDYLHIKYNEYSDLLINNEFVSLSNQSNINTDKSVFGNYENIYIYETNDVIFANLKEEYVQLKVSVIDNETFDSNLCLTFNGDGYLNGKEIDSGYIINKTGTYQLEIYGKNNERKVYQFEVDELSKKEVEVKEKNIVTNIKEEKKQVNNDMTLLYGEHLKNETTKTYYFFLLLIPLILLIVSLILVFRRKHEK